MSSLKFHTVQSVVTSAALYPFIGEPVFAFGCAAVLIDLDHVIEYVRDLKSCNLRGIFTYAQIIENNLDKPFLIVALFHTVEFFLLVLALSPVFPICKYIFAGMAYHVVADILYLKRLGFPYARTYSLVEYLWRKQNPTNVIFLRDLVLRDDVNTDVPGYHSWLKIWGLDQGRRKCPTKKPG